MRQVLLSVSIPHNALALVETCAYKREVPSRYSVSFSHRRLIKHFAPPQSMSRRESPLHGDTCQSARWTPPPAPAMFPFQLPPEGNIISNCSTHPKSAPRPRDIVKDHRPDDPGPLSQVSSARGRAEGRRLDFVAAVMVEHESNGTFKEGYVH
jgi:hypothetical protein